MEKALRRRQGVPVEQRTPPLAVSSRVLQDDYLRQPLHEGHVHTVCPAATAPLPHPVRRHAAQLAQCDAEQAAAVDVHEVATDVHLQYVARLRVVLALASYVALQAGDAVVRATVLDAAVRVLDEGALQHHVDVIVVEVVYDAVAELRGEDLAALRVGDDEAGGLAGAVGALPQLVAQCLQLCLGMALEAQLVRLLPLMAAGIEVGQVQVGQQLLTA